jgi:predicted TIM-barrel fold metal-dependent hydrolase
MTVIDSDQHLVEQRGMWREHADPSDRDLVVELVDDDLGWTTLQWQGRILGLADVTEPGQTAAAGARQERRRAGERNLTHYDEAIPVDHWDPAARADRLSELGVDEAILFPNYGLFWERRLSDSLPALRVNMTAWNRWCAEVAAEGRGRLHPVGHLTLRDLDWFEREVRALSAAGVRLAMVAPALVDGRPLSHPDLDRAWSLLSDHDITPTFHVADQPRPFDDAWYTDTDDTFVPTIDAVFIWTAAALACTDLIVNGVLDRHPELRIGIVELSAIWVPQFLLMLDGGVDFTTKLNGRAPAPLSRRPSEYFLDQVRVSSFAYELPERIIRQLGAHDILMACSDYPHTEGTADPLGDYARAGRGLDPDAAPVFFSDNARFLLRQT